MGRQREFDTTDALEKAMKVFWRQGYGETSIDDLVEGTGVSRYGLYSAFGDKHQLFLAALERYQQTHVAPIVRPLERPEASVPEIREFFSGIAHAPRDVELRRGCLICSSMTELAADDPKVAAHCRAYALRLRGLFLEALQRGQELGEVEPTVDVVALSATLTTQLVGISTLAKTPGAELLLSDAVRAIESLLPLPV